MSLPTEDPRRTSAAARCPQDAAGAAAEAMAVLPDLLLRPLGEDHELRHIFRGDIEERLRNSAAGEGELSADEAAAWLASRPGAVPGREPWLLPLLVVAGLLTLLSVAWEFYDFLPSLVSSPGAPQALREAGERQIYRIPPHREDNPLLDAGYDPAAAAEKSWRAHPDDPVLYYYYLRRSVNTLDNLPPDYEATWKRIDPDNAFWLLYQARLTLCHPSTALSGGAFSAFKYPYDGTPLAVGNAVEILLREASRLPHCHSYDLLLRDFLDDQRHVPVTSAQADALAMEVPLRDDGGYSDRGEWTRLSYEPEAHRSELAKVPQVYEKLKTRLGEIRDEVSAADETSSGWERAWILDRAGGVMKVRMLAVLSAAVFLGLAAVLILRQFPARGPAGRMALCLRQLLDPRRVLALVPKCVVPPVLLVVVLALFAGHREAYRIAFLPMAAVSPVMLSALTLLAAAMPSVMLIALTLMVESARREVSRRTAFLGLRSTAFQRRFGWIMPLLAGVSLVAVFSVAASYSSTFAALCSVAGGCYGVPLLWLGVRWLLGFVSPTANVRHRLIAGRLVPVLLIAVVSLNIVALCLHPVERSLVRKAVSQPGE